MSGILGIIVLAIDSLTSSTIFQKLLENLSCEQSLKSHQVYRYGRAGHCSQPPCKTHLAVHTMGL